MKVSDIAIAAGSNPACIKANLSLGHCFDDCVFGQDTLPLHASLDPGVNEC